MLSRSAIDRVSPRVIPRVAPQLARTILVSAIAFVLVFGSFALLWAKYINPFYFPYGDSFSVLVNSIPPFHPSVRAWFVSGFHTYFDAYPDISLHATNFIRPGVNATFYLGYFVYGTQWSHYLLTSYAIIGIIAALTCFIAVHLLRLSWPIALLATVCVAMAPSIDSGAIFDPTFAFDLLAGLLVLCGVASLITDALALSWLFFTLAIFTKEVALFAPLCAAIVLLLRHRERPLPTRIAVCTLFLLPLVAWLALRWFAFHHEKGLYVLMYESNHGFLHVAIVRTILGMLTWPLATVVYWEPTPAYLLGLAKLSVVVNVLFWLVLAIVLLKAILREETRSSLRFSVLRLFGTSTRSSSRPGAQPVYAIAVLALFCAGSLFLPIVLNMPRRFGGVFYPLFLLCMAAVISRASTRPVRTAAVCMTALVGVSGALLIASDLRFQTAKLKSTWTMSRNYIAELAHSSEPVMFSVDDLNGNYASNEYIQSFAGYKGLLVRVDDLRWNFNCQGGLQIAVQKMIDHSVIIQSTAPKRCGTFAFSSVFPPIDAQSAKVTRHLPVAILRYRPHDNIAANEIDLELDPEIPGGALLLPNLASLRYQKTELDPVVPTK